MNPDDLEWRVTRIAERVVREQGINALPVKPAAIARSLGIAVRAKPSLAQGISGMLVRFGNEFGILYGTHIANTGFQNFSIAHELGHYFLPGHIDAVIADGNHRSHADFRSGNLYEREADYFAAALLMPRQLFTNLMRSVGDGLPAIERLAELCQTSLTSTAIRYAQCCEDPRAIVLSTGDRINYCFMSETLRETSGLTWIRKNQVLPKKTVTWEFNQNNEPGSRNERSEGMSDLRDWFASDIRVHVIEEVMGLGNYGKTLTLLTAPSLLDYLEERQEDKSLKESWQPKFRL